MHHRRCHVCREMMTMNEMKTNDTMKKTKDTTDDARECAPLVPAPPLRSGALATCYIRTRRATLAKRAAACAAHLHAHVHVQGCLDIGLCAACQHRCRATGSRMHARGLFT